MNHDCFVPRSSTWVAILATAVLPSVVMQADTKTVPNYTSISNQSIPSADRTSSKPLTTKRVSLADKCGLQSPSTFQLGKDFHQTLVYKTRLNALISEAVLLQCEVGGDDNNFKSLEIALGASIFMPVPTESIPAVSEGSISVEGRFNFGQGPFSDLLFMNALYMPSWVFMTGGEVGSYNNTQGESGVNAVAGHVGAYIKPGCVGYAPEVVKVFFNVTNGLTSTSNQEKSGWSLGAYAKAAFSPAKMMNINWFRAIVIEVGGGGQFTQYPTKVPYERKVGPWWITPLWTLCLTRSDLNERAASRLVQGHPWRKQIITPPSYVRCLAKKMGEANHAWEAEQLEEERKAKDEREAEALKLVKQQRKAEVWTRAGQAENDVGLLSNAETVGMDKELFRSGLIDVLKDEEEGKGLHAVTHLINVVRSDALKLESGATEVENHNTAKQVYENIFCSLHYRRLNLGLEKYSKRVWDAEGIESTREAINQLARKIIILPSKMEKEKKRFLDIETKYYSEIQEALHYKYGLDVARFRAKFLPEGAPLSEKVLFEHSYLVAAWRKAINWQYLNWGDSLDFDTNAFKEFNEYLFSFRPNPDVSITFYLEQLKETASPDCYNSFYSTLEQLNRGRELIDAELAIWNAQSVSETQEALDKAIIKTVRLLEQLNLLIRTAGWCEPPSYWSQIKEKFIERVIPDMDNFTDKVRLALNYNENFLNDNYT